MTANVNSYQPMFMSEKKSVDLVQKDVKKWVDSVVEFKANLDKKKNESPLEKHLKKVKKFKVKKRTNLVAEPTVDPTNPTIAQHVKQVVKPKKIRKAEKSVPKDPNTSPNAFDQIKETYHAIKLPSNWTSGISAGRIIFNKIKLSTHNAQQRMSVERSLVITKDCTAHVLISGSEITLNNWEMEKVATLEDVKKAIKDIETLKLCEGSSSGAHCLLFVNGQNKTCPACKEGTNNSQKGEPKNRTGVKKPVITKRKTAPKQKLLLK